MIESNSLTAVLKYIEKHNIKSVDIRFLDEKFQIKCITLPPNSLTKKMFVNHFNLLGYKLTSLSIGRKFKDPFLANTTLVFLTNLVKHIPKVKKLLKLKTDKAFPIKYAIEEQSNNKNSFVNIGSNRNFRDEVVLSATEIHINIVCNTYLSGTHILFLKEHNYLNYLDSIEKLKYAITSVADAYNKNIKLQHGIFNKPCLLACV